MGFQFRDLTSVAADQTSPAAAGAATTTPQTGFSKFFTYAFLGNLRGATGGTLDIVIEHSPDGVNWYELGHFPQQAAAAAATAVFAVKSSGGGSITAVGKNLTTTTVLAVSVFIGAPYFDTWRVRYVAGASTSAGAAQSVVVQLWDGLM